MTESHPHTLTCFCTRRSWTSQTGSAKDSSSGFSFSCGSKSRNWEAICRHVGNKGPATTSVFKAHSNPGEEATRTATPRGQGAGRGLPSSQALTSV